MTALFLISFVKHIVADPVSFVEKAATDDLSDWFSSQNVGSLRNEIVEAMLKSDFFIFYCKVPNFYMEC